MQTLKVIDVTLRDGGHRVNFNFSDADIDKILPMLDQTGVAYVEVGYRNGTYPYDAEVGPSGLCQQAYLRKCRDCLPHVRMAVMAYPQYITAHDMHELKDVGVDLLRICVIRGELPQAIQTAELAHHHHMDVALNITQTSKYTDEALDEVVAQIAHLPLKAIYLADSNGSLTPTDIKALYAKYTTIYHTPFGFHAHDNLGLAQANTIAAIEENAEFIDCSLTGLGKGIGNLRAEFFLAYLQKMHLGNYALDQCLMAANYVRRTFYGPEDGLHLDDFLHAINNH